MTSINYPSKIYQICTDDCSLLPPPTPSLCLLLKVVLPIITLVDCKYLGRPNMPLGGPGELKITSN